MERLCDWVVNKNQVWVHGDRITDGHVVLDMSGITGLDPDEVSRDGQWVIRKAQPSRWVAPEHPDLSDAIPSEADESGWSEVLWSVWVTKGLRVGAVNRTAVAVDDAWLSRLQTGYRIEGSPGHSALRIVSESPVPTLLSGSATAHRRTVGVVMPAQIEGSDSVIEAIVNELGGV
ncbi:hypothetical protein SSP35_22_00020 [Streptomyces sp. NBRC 110611]|nr:hypothetical protein SSP35_22_00020 [Streptomyces sp. NBRC 110611]